MAIPISAESLLKGGVIENARIELKETWDAAASLKTICAFANDLDNWGGGYLIIGVCENEDGSREVVGVGPAAVDRILKDMLNGCKRISPDYMPIVDVAEFEGKQLIIAWCPGGSVRPYSCPRSMSKGEKARVCYIRKLASTIEPSGEELRDLYTLANNVPFDDRPNHAAVLEDLNPTLIKSFLREVGSDLYTEADSLPFKDLCRRMDIVAGPDEYLKPKNVGLLFFSDDPRRFFPCAQIDVVEFPEGLGGDRIIESTFIGPLDQQLRDALRYLQNSVIKETIVKRGDKAESLRFFNYPFGAVEEALANAVYHKGYDVREPVEVRVLPDRIEILSYPGADRSISREGLRTYRAISRRYRNRRVGDFLKELRLTEGRNTGISKILRSMRNNGSPDPLFETDDDRLYFLTTLHCHAGFAASDSEPEIVSAEPGQVSSASVLTLLREDPSMTQSRMAKELGVSTATVARYIAALRDAGLIRRVGSPRTGWWEIL
ncbi:MAG: ATP-binding protein [Coriobacteriia bacterium]|nr:ATP-binding protein [Coriobacteriia bacterium]